MPGDLLESELFGYDAGAFTGASTSKPGKFEMCNHGTMLLDEIGEMSPMLQAKLLQVLQDGTFERLGARNTIRVDVRLIAATNIDIPRALASEEFRTDLYYRLNGITLVVPPLRERPEDIPVLLKHYLTLYAKTYAFPQPALSSVLLEACSNYRWPGNVRELCNFAKRMIILGDEAVMIRELMEPTGISTVSCVAGRNCDAGQPGGGLKSMVRNLKGGAESAAILAALLKTDWNRRRAAEDLNISYRALLYKIQQYNVVAPVHTA
jgi:transcriptional regulator with PAS, ATPase and Fis domain